MISQETKERISKDAEDRYPSKRYVGKLLKDRELDRQQAYIAGAEAEAEKAQGLVEPLEKIVAYKGSFFLNINESNKFLEEIVKTSAEALNQYNNTSK